MTQDATSRPVTDAFGRVIPGARHAICSSCRQSCFVIPLRYGDRTNCCGSPELRQKGGQVSQVKIYGHSDDLVLVRGNVPGCDEFNIIDRPLFIELGCGDVFRVEYTDCGVWKIDHHKMGLATSVEKTPYSEGDDPEPYTDTVVITGNIAWVEAWESYPPTTEEMDEKMGRLLVRDDTLDRAGILSAEEVRAIWKIVSAAKRRCQ